MPRKHCDCKTTLYSSYEYSGDMKVMRYAKISHAAPASKSNYLLVEVHAQSPNIIVQFKANQPSNFRSRYCRTATLPKLAGPFPRHPRLPPSLASVVPKRWASKRRHLMSVECQLLLARQFPQFPYTGTSFSKAQVQENVFKWNDQKKDFS